MTIFVLFLESMSSTLHPIILHVRTRSYKKKNLLSNFPLTKLCNFLSFFFLFFFWSFLRNSSRWENFRARIEEFSSSCLKSESARKWEKKEKKIIAMYNFFYSSFISSYSLNANVLVPCIKITRRHGQNFLIELCYHCQYAYRHAHITHCHEKTWSVQFSDHLRFKLNKEWSCGWNEKEKKNYKFSCLIMLMKKKKKCE